MEHGMFLLEILFRGGGIGIAERVEEATPDRSMNDTITRSSLREARDTGQLRSEPPPALDCFSAFPFHAVLFTFSFPFSRLYIFLFDILSDESD